ncbi:MAG: TonB-dependent receptor [Acidobacteria bacterium]|nr:TonB-dependent receptor [Acidobacteriota bacterium]
MALRVKNAGAVVVLSMVLVFAASAVGQTLEKGAITGTVYDPSGAVVPGAAIKIIHVATGTERELTSGTDGRFSAPLLSPGEYRMEVSVSGFATSIVRGVRLAVGQELIQDINLQVAAVGQTVDVTAEAGLIDRSDALEKNVVSQVYVEQLPISGRDFRDFVSLAGTGDTTPGLRSPVRLGGQQGEYTGLIIDGVDNRDGFFGEWFGSLETKNFTFPQDAVQEFQVRETGFSAEFGHATGGLINVVTKSGTNDWHGSVHWFFQSNSFFGDNSVPALPGQVIPPPFNTRHQFGGTIGGPIVRDKLFLFFAIDAQEQAGPLGTAFEQDVSGVAVPELGIANLQDEVGGSTQRQDLRAPFLRVDYQITSNTHGTSRANYTRNETDNFTGGRSQIFVGNAADSNFENFVNEGPAFLQSVTTVINPLTVNEARFAYSRERRDRINRGPGPETVITGVGAFGRRFFLPITGHTQRYQVIDNFSRTFGKHDLKLGVDLNSNATNQAFIGFAGGVYNFASLADFVARRPTNYRQLFGINGFDAIESGTLTDFWQHELSFYIQDSWKVTPHLTLNLGLRWDGVWNPNPEFPIIGDLVALGEPRIRGGVLEQEVGPPPQDIPDDFNNWAPRVGVAWDATGDGKTLVRGGLGIYYAPFPTIFMASTLAGMGFRGADTFIPFDPLTGMDSLGLGLTYPNTLPLAAPAVILPLLPPPNITFADPELESARVFNLQFGVEREIVPDLSISGTYTHNRSQNLRTGGFNSTPWDRTIDPTGVTFDSFGRTVGGFNPTGCPQFAVQGNCRLPQSINPVTGNPVIGGASGLSSFGRGRYHAFILQVKKTYSHRHQFQINYVLSKNEDNATTDRDADAFFGPSDPFNLDLDFGRSQLDIRHQFRAYAYFLLPADIEFSTIITARSGRAYPAYRTFGFCPDVDFIDGFQCANFFLAQIRPVDGSRLLPRFPFRNQDFVQWDIRFGRAFALGTERARVRFTFEVFNLMDKNNAFSTTTGFSTNAVLPASVFGGPERRDGPTLPINAQFGIKFIF